MNPTRVAMVLELLAVKRCGLEEADYRQSMIFVNTEAKVMKIIEKLKELGLCEENYANYLKEKYKGKLTIGLRALGEDELEDMYHEFYNLIE